MVRDSGADDEDVDVGITVTGICEPVEASDVPVVVVAAAVEVSITLPISVHR